MLQKDFARFDFDVNSVEEIVVADCAAKGAQPICELARQAMNAFGDCAQSFWAVINRIHRRNNGKKHLSRADVARRLVATDVLLPCLQRESIRRPPFSVVRHTHESTSHVTFEWIARGEICGVRPAESQRHAEALRITNRDIRAKFARRFQQRERENIRRHDNECACAVSPRDEVGIIIDRAIRGWILD